MEDLKHAEDFNWFDDFERVHDKIQKFKKNESVKRWGRKNPKKKKNMHAKWYAKFGKEYYRNYREKNNATQD